MRRQEEAFEGSDSRQSGRRQQGGGPFGKGEIRREKAGDWTVLQMGVSQPGSSTEQPNPQIPDITSFSRPGPTASPSPSYLPLLWGQGRDSELASPI